MILLFEVILEVKIETRFHVYKECITLATIPYLPRITMSRRDPLEIGDDYLLEEVSTEVPHGNPSCKIATVMDLRNAKIVLEGIVSERDAIVQQIEVR